MMVDSARMYRLWETVKSNASVFITASRDGEQFTVRVSGVGSMVGGFTENGRMIEDILPATITEIRILPDVRVR